MHVQLVFLFSMIAAIPTLLVVIFASWLFQSGVEFWFSDNSRGLLENANKLARGYYEQTQRDVSNETTAMASDLRGVLSAESIASPKFSEFYVYQVVNRRLDESAIVQKGEDGQLRTAAIVDPASDTSRSRITPEVLRRVDGGETIVINATANKIEAVTPIDRRSGVYLYTARVSDLLDPEPGPARREYRQGLRSADPARAGVAIALQRRIVRAEPRAGRLLRLAGAAFRRPAGEADLRAGRCGAAGGQRQFRPAGGRAHRRRRDRPAQPRVQPHDRAARKADPGAGRRQPPAARPPRLHRGGARIGVGGDRLDQSGRPDPADEQLGAKAAARQAGAGAAGRAPRRSRPADRRADRGAADQRDRAIRRGAATCRRWR